MIAQVATTGVVISEGPDVKDDGKRERRSGHGAGATQRITRAARSARRAP